MSHISAKSERVIAARPEDVYDVLADYKNKRPEMLTPNFLDYAVEKGGHGSGTVVRYRLHAANRERPYHMRVDEAVKDQMLVERDTNSSLVTTWKLFPLHDGRYTKVSVATEWEGGHGIGGFFERTFAPLGLRRIYDHMLSLLTAQVQPSEATRPGHKHHHGHDHEHRHASPGLGRLFMLSAIATAIAVALGLKYLQHQHQEEIDHLHQW